MSTNRIDAENQIQTPETDTTLRLAPDGAGGVEWGAGGTGLTNPMTTTGDIIYSSDGSGTPARRAVGTANQLLHGGTTPAYSAVVEGDLSTSDITTANVVSTKHGFAPKSPADATTFLNGAATPAYAAVKDSDLATTDITTNNVSTTKHGFAPKSPNDATKYLDGTGAYTVPSGGSATPLNPGIFAEISSPSTPSSGTVAVYAKADGRIYSKDDAGVESGPFDAAGGGTLYAYDELFPGVSLPAGWTFTGSGTCVVAAGAATVTSGAQSDRLMFAYTPPTDGIVVIRAHLLAISGEGGMPSLVAFDSGGNGYGTGPYNDSNWYAWAAQGTGYQYSGTDVLVAASPSLTDVWASLLIIDGYAVGAGFSSDGAAWTGMLLGSSSQEAITQVGICQLWTSANMVISISELTITEP